MKITPISGSLGVDIEGMNVNSASEAEFAELETAFLTYKVLAIRDQRLTPLDLLALTDRFGGPGDTPYLGGMDEYPNVVAVVKEPDEKSPHTFGAGWHTDFTFQAAPPTRTLLYAVDTPPVCGDTLYCNLHNAYQSLSVGMQKALANLNAVHSAVRSYGPKATLKNHMENMRISNDANEPTMQLHPVIRMHDDTGEPVLWVNPTYTIAFEDMTEQESAPILNYLNQLAVLPGNCCRVRWQPGTLTMWDNRSTQHCATSDYQGHRREMWRTTTQGKPPTRYTVSA